MDDVIKVDLIFCDKCRDWEEFEIKNVPMVSRIRHTKAFYNSHITYCKNCGSEVYNKDEHDYNLNILFDTYIQKRGLVTKEQLANILTHIPIDDLAKQTKCHSSDISKIINGFIPSKGLSKKLLKIYNTL